MLPPHITGVSAKDVDVVELHDCFSTNELITYEALVSVPPHLANLPHLTPTHTPTHTHTHPHTPTPTHTYTHTYTHTTPTGAMW